MSTKSSAEQTKASPGSWRGRLARLVAIDLRALAVFRMLIGCILLWDLADRARFMTDHYTDSGIAPRGMVALRSIWWSLHAISGDVWLQWLLFAVAAVAALALTVGMRTRLATLVSCILLVSLQQRNPYITNGGDTLLRCLVFWSVFLPLGARWSFDRCFGGKREPAPQSLSTIATAAILLQLAMVYWFSASLKIDPIWHRDYTAIYLALGYEQYALPLANWLRMFPTLLAGMTMFVYWLEWLGPCLIFSPWATSRSRTAVAALFIGMHIGLMLSMHLGVFSIVCVTAWLLVLPATWWDRLEQLTEQIRALLPESFSRSWISAHAAAALGDFCQQPRLRLGTVSRTAVGLLLVYAISWNLLYSYDEADLKRYVPEQTRWIGNLTGLKQRWNMFAPKPPTRSYEFELVGVTDDGRKIDLWTMTPREHYTPIEVSSHRWRKYLSHLPGNYHALHCYRFADWAKQRWNEQHAAGDYTQRVVAVEIVGYRKANVLPDQPPPPIETRQLYASNPSR